jgi:phosphoserine phosphatase
VASELEIDDQGIFTGRFVPPLAIGEGKVVRAERFASEMGIALEEATFYSDSFTDLPLLERVKVPVVVNPDLRLRRAALRRGWRIERW